MAAARFYRSSTASTSDNIVLLFPDEPVAETPPLVVPAAIQVLDVGVEAFAVAPETSNFTITNAARMVSYHSGGPSVYSSGAVLPALPAKNTVPMVEVDKVVRAASVVVAASGVFALGVFVFSGAVLIHPLIAGLMILAATVFWFMTAIPR